MVTTFTMFNLKENCYWLTFSFNEGEIKSINGTKENILTELVQMVNTASEKAVKLNIAVPEDRREWEKFKSFAEDLNAIFSCCKRLWND